MRTCLFFYLFFYLFFAPVATLARSSPGNRAFLSTDNLAEVRKVADPRVSPDGLWIAYTVTTADLGADAYVSTLWMVNWSDDTRVQLTYGPDSGNKPRWSPDGKYLAFLSSRGDDQSGNQVWLLDRKGGEARRLTDVRGSVSDYAWSPDAQRLALVAKLTDDTEALDTRSGEEKRPQPIVIDRYQFKSDDGGYLSGPERDRIYLYDMVTGELGALTTDTQYDEYEPVWSPDGTRIAFYSNRDSDPDRTANTDIFVAEAKRLAQPRKLTDYKGQDLGTLAWSSDGRTIAYVQGPEPKYWLYEFSQVAVVAVDGGAPALPTAFLDRDTNYPMFSKDGRSLEIIVTDDRSRYLARVPLKGGKLDRLTPESQVVSRFSRGGGHTAVLLARPGMPAEVFALDHGRTRRLTHHNGDWLATVEFGAVQGVAFPSTDGEKQIGALVTKPPRFEQGRKYPTILWIHGGPYGQDEYGFDFERQLFAANGYIVVQVNYRGSSGRGAAFGEAIFADWGNKDAADVIAGIDHVIRLGLADPDRLGVGGWSQGGIITNYVIASDTRFKAAIAGAGAANQLGLYGSDQYVFMYDNEFSPPWEDPELWIRLSYPFFHADRIRTPTFYLGGDKDFNVPIIGGEQMYQALKSLGVPTQLVIYPGEHHSFARPSFDKDVLDRYLAWFGSYLKPGS